MNRKQDINKWIGTATSIDVLEYHGVMRFCVLARKIANETFFFWMLLEVDHVSLHPWDKNCTAVLKKEGSIFLLGFEVLQHPDFFLLVLCKNLLCLVVDYLT